MLDDNIKPLTIEINREVWYKFKELIPRTITLNNAVVALIINKIKEDGRGQDE